MKILILCDHYPLSPRVKKVRNSMINQHENCEIKVFAWNRESKPVMEDYVEVFNQNIEYGNKKDKAINLARFTLKAKEYFNKFNPDYIHAIDFEMLISSVIISRKAKIIYEVYDIKFLRNKVLNWIREKLELNIIKKYVSAMVLASPYFEIYYNSKGINKITKITINNKPSKRLETFKSNEYMLPYESTLKNKTVIGFVGTIRYKNILLNLINAANNIENIIILLAGSGPNFNDIKEYIETNNLQHKVIMTGRYQELDLPSIYNVCDYIWAAYPNKDINVKYAISNKFFESIIFKKRVIVSEKTMIGQSVIDLNIGYTVDPHDVVEIISLLTLFDKGYRFDSSVMFDNSLFWEDEEVKLLNIYCKSITNVEGVI
ncbi:glycosyltransferase [Alkaliphilus sp. B6464]|uniref:glycosyltransferase n=1 Tax=Alkaliphilus sp. B6464 TaxID=2731219 RepID=UPI001BA53DED|nr:glycosyltransferase [Alkaliphilus sp. B6464]QUH19067.1 glycosyltransferase [Alkaliphilus sp. B6464]